MKLRYIIAAIGAATLLGACEQNNESASVMDTEKPATSAPTAADDSAVVAEINGTKLTEAELELYTQQRQTRRPGDPADKRAVLEEMINLELARQKGMEMGLDDNPEVALQIQQQRRAVLAAAAIQQHIREQPISEEDLRKIYDDNVSVDTEYKARHILVEEKETAEKLIDELEGGADFETLAKENSTGPSADSGGDLGWFSAKQMVEPFSNAVADMDKDSVSKEPVQTQFGWHVIKLEDKRESSPPDFEMLRPQIMSMVQNQRVQQYIQSLREDADINIVAEFEKAEPAPAMPEDAGEEPQAEEEAPEPAATADEEATTEAEPQPEKAE